jgi:hypothetical protein
MRNRVTKLIVVAVAVAAFPILFSSWNARSTSAAGGGAWRTGMFSIARGQTARINALCLPPGPCHVGMMFLDKTGNVASRWEHDPELRPGQAAFFDYSFEIPFEQRVQLRAVGITSANRDDKSKAGNVLFSSEVFDNDTGRTTITPTFEECTSCKEQ